MINTLRIFQQKLEVEFWQFVIPRMKDKPVMVKKIANVIFSVQKNLPKKSILFQAFFWSCMGLSIGLGIGILIA